MVGEGRKRSVKAVDDKDVGEEEKGEEGKRYRVREK